MSGSDRGVIARDEVGPRSVLIIAPGNAGQDARAWAQMLSGMYRRMAHRKGFAFDELEGPLGLRIDCEAGALAQEVGVHRLVRESPFDHARRRRTAFCSVSVSADGTEIENPLRVPGEQNHAVRSYVLDPYRLVTDHYTGGRGDPDAVLDGDWDQLRKSAPLPAPPEGA